MDTGLMNYYIDESMENDIRKLVFEFNMKSQYTKTIEAKLGKKKIKCQICESIDEFESILLIENQFQTKERFPYFECSMCGCLQAVDTNNDMGKYYPKDYYSYAQPETITLQSKTITDYRYVLDVGCGAGKWLCQLASIGFIHLHGCDPYIEKDIVYPNGVKIKKCSIHDMQGEYDLIRLDNSYEHMADQHEVFQTLDKLLKKDANAQIELIIPKLPCFSYDLYGIYAHMLDAPRHLFIHTVKSITYLANKYEFFVERVDEMPYWDLYLVSDLYQYGETWKSFGDAFLNKKYYDDNTKQQNVFKLLSTLASFFKYADVGQFIIKRKK